MKLLTHPAILRQHRVFYHMASNILRNRNILNPVSNSSQNQKNVNSKAYSTEEKKQNLLRFPAFPLDETLTRFLATTKPLLTKEEQMKTKRMADEFRKGDGAKLQELLEKAAASEENWLAHRWLRAAYLQYRDPVTVYSSPGMTFPIQCFETEEDFINYAAVAVYHLIGYKKLIDNGEIPVVKMGKNELDNSQFGRVLGTCRIPKPQEDAMDYNPDSQHIVVICKNHFYKFAVYDKSGKPLSVTTMAQQLMNIWKAETEKGCEFGVLTTIKRDNWAEAYKILMEIPGNAESVCEIQKSLFTLSLDDCVPVEKGQENIVLAGQLIHGGGVQYNSSNRWMDKTIQLIVNRNGLNGFCYEHSPAEGVPIALMMDHVVKKMEKGDKTDGASDNFECPVKLKLTTSECLNMHVAAAKHYITGLAFNLRMNILHYTCYGKGFLKTQKLSPDSFIQMAIQLAFYRYHKVPGAQYESAHLRIYTGGRTETIRSCSVESVAFAKAMMDKEVSNEERAKLLRKAVNSHREYTSLALQGRGVDRHLLGLKLMAVEYCQPIPKFFSSPGFVKSSTFRISTSQVASKNNAFMCYGPTTDNGYGCCYNPRDDDLILACSAWRNNKETNVDEFVKALVLSLDQMWDVLVKTSEQPKAKL
ncbi:carnitine O-acetyltransferase isoform X2 [Teleopsis dalmanni]|nr:carnitine O-acetyltransferase isoform X2 [Teleopsis dalmanni]XP_037958105.1 carnitine O-acetyltransferase isoform X2 [Teleopsis dalmanni]